MRSDAWAAIRVARIEGLSSRYVFESWAGNDSLHSMFTFFSRCFFVFCLLSTTLISEAKADKWVILNVWQPIGENLYQGFIGSETFDSLKACESYLLDTLLKNDLVAEKFMNKIHITEWFEGKPYLTFHCEKIYVD